jgi:transposase-like protein
MTSNTKVSTSKQRRRLSPSEKYEVFVSVLTGRATEREVAQTWRVDRTAVAQVCRTAKQGALEEARAKAERSRAAVTEEAVALHLHEWSVGLLRPLSMFVCRTLVHIMNNMYADADVEQDQAHTPPVVLPDA